MSTFYVKCPQCGVALETEEQYIGSKAKCAECGSRFIIPQKENISYRNIMTYQFDKNYFLYLIKLPFMVKREV